MTLGRSPFNLRWAFCALPLLCALLLPGCQAPRGPVSIDSDDPDLKIQAIQDDADRKETRNIPKMVQDLSSDDSAIRFYAIQALRRITREDFGYRFYEDEDQRKPAVDRWQAWLKARR